MKEVRHERCGCFNGARDGLWDKGDELRSEKTANILPELLLSPFFQRKWASEYKALEEGKIRADRLREVFVQFAPLPGTSQHVYLGVDTSNLYRREAETSADRTMVPIPNLPECDRAVPPGWVISS